LKSVATISSFAEHLNMIEMTINCKGKLLDLSKPKVMGILNLTPDSFYDGGQYTVSTDKAMEQVKKMIDAGVDIIDIGGMSSRPGATIITPQEEIKRVLPVIQQIMAAFPQAILSIDTISSAVAEEAVHVGASIVNDISGGDLDPNMFKVVAKLGVPYMLMHMRGTPETMQSMTDYDDLVVDVYDDLRKKLKACKEAGIKDTIIDVGFGFAKTTEQNYVLLKQLSIFTTLDVPLLVGVSRKGMITKVLQNKAEDALNGTTVLNTIALLNGATILRVHDVKEAKETIHLVNQYKAANV